MQIEKRQVEYQTAYQIDILCILVKAVPKLFSSEQPYLVSLYSALLSTIYYGLFRIGELTQNQHVGKACDVHIGENKNKMHFLLRSSKTHNFGDNPQIVKISSSPSPIVLQTSQIQRICPFDPLKKYIQCRKQYINQQEQFFVFKDRSPVQPRHLKDILKKLLIMHKIDFSLYSVHTFRAG